MNRGVERPIAERVISTAQRAVRDWTPALSEFLTPPESAAMLATLRNLPDLRVAAWGGYPDAERTAILCAHSETVDSPEEVVVLMKDQLVLFKLVGNFEFDNGKLISPVTPVSSEHATMG